MKPELARQIMGEAIERDGGLQTELRDGPVVWALTLNADGDGYKGVGFAQDSTEGNFRFRARGRKVEGVQPPLGTYATPSAAAKAVAMDAGTRVAPAAQFTPSPTPPPPPLPAGPSAAVAAEDTEADRGGSPEAEKGGEVTASPSTPPSPPPS